MTRTQVSYILSLAKCRSFGAAADECFISQSTLSAMIAKFEEQIGIEIFSRKTRPICVTDKGQKIINALENIHREFLMLDERVREIKEIEEGHIRLACIPTVAPFLFPMSLDKISQSFSKVDFNIYELTTENIVRDLINGKIDIGIVSLPLNDKHLEEHHLYDESFYIYDYGSKNKTKKYKVSDIDINRLWILEEGHCMRNQIGKICNLKQKKRMNGNLTYNCGSINTLIEMVHKNKGITLLPQLAIDNNQNIVRDHIHSFKGTALVRKIGIVVHKNFARRRFLGQLIQILKESVNIKTYKSSNLKYLDPY